MVRSSFLPWKRAEIKVSLEIARQIGAKIKYGHREKFWDSKIFVWDNQKQGSTCYLINVKLCSDLEDGLSHARKSARLLDNSNVVPLSPIIYVVVVGDPDPPYVGRSWFVIFKDGEEFRIKWNSPNDILTAMNLARDANPAEGLGVPYGKSKKIRKLEPFPALSSPPSDFNHSSSPFSQKESLSSKTSKSLTLSLKYQDCLVKNSENRGYDNRKSGYLRMALVPPFFQMGFLQQNGNLSLSEWLEQGWNWLVEGLRLIKEHLLVLIDDPLLRWLLGIAMGLGSLFGVVFVFSRSLGFMKKFIGLILLVVAGGLGVLLYVTRGA